MNERSDAELAAAYIAGDRDAVGVLFARYRVMIAATARHYGARREADVEDVAGEVAMAMVRALHSWTPGRGEGLSSWVYTITRNRTLDMQRREKTRGAWSLTHENPTEWVVSDPGTDIPMHVEAAASAAEVFARLSEDHREVLWLTHVTGHTTREVAGFLGIPEGTVKTRRFRALAHARIAARSVA